MGSNVTLRMSSGYTGIDAGTHFHVTSSSAAVTFPSDVVATSLPGFESQATATIKFVAGMKEASGIIRITTDGYAPLEISFKVLATS